MNALFFLPINIAKRRIHICHFETPVCSHGYEFIIPIYGNDIELFSIPLNAKLISSRGSRHDKPIVSLKYDIACQTSESAPTELNVEITFSSHSGKNTALDMKGLYIGRDRGHRFFHATLTSQLEYKKINVKISFTEGKDNTSSYSFIIHTPRTDQNGTEIYKAAIDFGSEASQVGIKDYMDNDKPAFIPLVDSFKAYYDEYKNKPTNFWQESRDSNSESSWLYKSVFFIHKRPVQGYDYSDPPNSKKDRTFLKSLFPIVTSFREGHNVYNDHFLLPNLKLVELLPKSSFYSEDVFFSSSANNPHAFENTQNIFSDKLINDFIRLILNSLLFAIIQRLNASRRTEKYLFITLLMPNVYSQKKAYELIRNFYTDFKEIARTQFPNFKGIEINALSESDASFLGVRNAAWPDEENRLSIRNDANYLVIDAGKGTTDFSIIQQQGDAIVKYDSLFRSGLPGSGQMLSYAFIEALNEFLPEHSLLSLITKEEDYPNILAFMENIEILKSRHKDFKDLHDGFNEIKKPEFQLEKVNAFVKNEFINKNLRIPGSDRKVRQKIDELIEAIRRNINYSGIQSFHQMVLAGRAFRFAPLLEAVTNTFSGMITGKNKVLYLSKQSKFICIEGAFQNESVHINLNSELMGNPVLLDQDNNKIIPDKSFWETQKAYEKKIKENGFINENFFYNGINIDTHLRNKIIRIGGRNYDPRVSFRDHPKSNIFYIGSSFILRAPDEVSELTEGPLPQNLNEMAEASLFPFASISFGDSSSTDGHLPVTDTPTFKTSGEPDQNKKETDKKPVDSKSGSTTISPDSNILDQ